MPTKIAMTQEEMISHWLPAIAIVFPEDTDVTTEIVGGKILINIAWRPSVREKLRTIKIKVEQSMQSYYAALSEYEQGDWIDQMQQFLSAKVLVSPSSF